MTVTAIIHGCRWPDRSAVDNLRDSLAASLPASSRIVEAREREPAPIGAAAILNEALSAEPADLFLCLEPSTAWTELSVGALVEGARLGLAFDRAHPSRAWAVTRHAFAAAGGLDTRLWSVGFVEDLAARLDLLGVPAARLELAGSWHGPDAYPLAPEVRAFLEARNPLITAFKTLDDQRLGPAVALLAASAWRDAYRSAALDAGAFHFGSRRVIGPDDVWPADEAGTVLPLLALDSFLELVPLLLAERRDLARRRRRPAADDGAGQGDLLALVEATWTRAGAPP